MEKVLHIIYIEDNASDADFTKRALTKAGFLFSMVIVETEEAFIKALDSNKPDLVLSDHSLPSFNSMEAYKISRAKIPGTPFILLTGSVSEEFAVDCLLAGIDDYILKSNIIRLPSSVQRVLAKKKILDEKQIIENLHKELQNTHRLVEVQNKEIIDSITYASRIQDAILPQDSRFMEDFYAGVCLFKPRDIVSGDFYWLAKTTTTDEKALSLNIIAAIDCTGHGIPGAFMSLLASELLNQTLKNKDINSPADVLKYLNHQLPYSLNKNNKERINDGLDIALCAIDTAKRVVYFAGANRPLWIVKKNNDNYNLLEYKGTKASIGGHTSTEQVFENITIELEQGDRLFLFTDGITDQFGGEKGKKLGRRNLKQVILESSTLAITEQKTYLLDYITRWKGGLEQVDDMLLIGIQIH